MQQGPFSKLKGRVSQSNQSLQRNCSLFHRLTSSVVLGAWHAVAHLTLEARWCPHYRWCWQQALHCASHRAITPACAALSVVAGKTGEHEKPYAPPSGFPFTTWRLFTTLPICRRALDTLAEELLGAAATVLASGGWLFTCWCTFQVTLFVGASTSAAVGSACAKCCSQTTALRNITP